MPVLSASTPKTARLSVQVQPAGLSCDAELYLSTSGGATKAATSGKRTFVSTGAAQVIELPITTPAQGGVSYTVYIDIGYGGMLLGEYQASENVIIPYMGTPTVVWV